MSRQTAIEVTGVKQTIQALESFAPEIKERLNREIRKALKSTETRAQSKYPKGAYTVQINKKKLLGSVTTRRGSVGGKRWGEADAGPRAAIFEFAGSNQDGRTPQAKGLIKSLNARYGTTGRFLWAAWDETGKDVLENIRTSLLSAERDLQSKLDSIGESF
jgi:hypothetical protein